MSANTDKPVRLSRVRRIVMLVVLGLFVLQFARVKALVGGLTGSLALWYVKMIDVFAFVETSAASRSVAESALVALVPVVLVYLVFGRAFCGWICPMDFIFELVGRGRRPRPRRVGGWVKYAVAGGFLAVSFALGVPVFSAYISHLTNIFRAMTSGVSMAMGLPLEPIVLWVSLGALGALVVLELIFPRLWCRGLCPVGASYGLFNKASLLKLRFAPERQCTGCNACNDVCYMGVDVASRAGGGDLRDTNCIYCGRCEEGCRATGDIIRLTLRR